MQLTNCSVNVLGYLNLAAYGDEYAESANAGMLDIVQALGWVKDNIGNFGGDPGNVTIFGQSGGGGKVCTLMAMPSSRGLFHKAIVESGAMLTVGNEESSRALAAAILQKLGLDAAQVGKLHELSFHELDSAVSSVIPPINPGARMDFRTMGSRMGLAPVADGKVVSHQPFEPTAPAAADSIPLLIGSTLNEFTNGINHPDAFELTEQQMKSRVETMLPGHGAELISSYRKLYPNANPFQLWSIIATTGVRSSTLLLAERKSAQSAPVYCYQFAWQTPVLDGRPMAYHCSEMPFVFDNPDLCEHMTGGGEAAHVLASQVSAAWMSFARNGDPNNAGLPHWKRFNASDKTTMIFDDRCEAKDNLDTDQLQLLKKARG